MGKKQTGANRKNPPVGEKRKDPPTGDGTKKKKQRKNGNKAIVVERSTKDSKFYLREGSPQESLCNLLLQKRLAQPSKVGQSSKPLSFEYRSGKDFSGNLYTSCHGTIQADKSNLLVGGLSPQELQMWSSYVGAAYAAKRCPPVNIARKLGKITRRILLPRGSKSKMKQSWQCVSFKTRNIKKAAPPSHGKLAKELHHTQPFEPGETEEDRKLRLASSAKALAQSWSKSADMLGNFLPNWNKHGEIPIVPVATRVDDNKNGPSNIKYHPSPIMASVVAIREMLESKKWMDDTECNPSEKELYHLKIPTDTLSVLKALEALATPDHGLYGVPLVLAISLLEPIPTTSSESSNWRPFRLTISVYAHRLLFECMTADALRTVMAALDEDEGNVSSIARPLVKSPAVGPIVFGKDPETKVEILERDDDDSSADDSDAIDDHQLKTRTSDTLDAFSTEGFLKLIENQGVSGIDTIYKDKIEPVLYGKDNEKDPILKVSLLPHQVHGVCWMYQMETLDEGGTHDKIGSSNTNSSLGLNGLLWERRRFHEGDTFYYSPALGQARLTIGEGAPGGIKPRARRGGILADEMGLGKTVQALALVLTTLDDLRKEKASFEKMDDGNSGKMYSHATLIIVPPALVGQWRNEIRKITGDNLFVQFLDHKDQNIPLEVNPSADIVLTTYQTLESKGKKFTYTIWGRIILDEMQEVRSWNTTVSKACQELECDRRWMLSGTPLWEGIKDFKGELCFLGLEPFAANNEDGFFNFAVANHWKARSIHGLEILRILSLVMLRRTKSMSILENGLPLLGLKKLTLVFEPVPQGPAERAMYCFLEFVMHSLLLMSDATKSKQNRLIFLRLLRELCVSPYLINGGLGCNSQLGVLNRLMKEYNRMQLAKSDQTQANATQNDDTENNENIRLYSCDEAIHFLSQVEDEARTHSDFVTDTRLGGGGGISRRNRALLINPQEEIERAREKIAKSTEIREKARSNRAKAWWQWALEGVTTGRLRDKSCYEATSPSVLELWKWRDQVWRVKPTTTLSFLSRGFRPTEKYFNFPGSANGDLTGKAKQQHEREQKLVRLGKRQPEFRWAHPFAFRFSYIPIEVSDAQLQESIENVVDTVSSSSPSSQILCVRESPASKRRDAIVQFSNRETFDYFEKCVKKVDRVQVKIQEQLPFIKKEIAAAKAKYLEASAMFKVHPCEANERNLVKAKTALKKSKLGLCILDEGQYRVGQILCTRAFGYFRDSSPNTSGALLQTSLRQIEEATAHLDEHLNIINQQEKRIQSMERKIKLNVAGTGVENLNTVDGLQALKNGQCDKTNCPICFDNLGEGDGSNGKVALTRCGHMSCTGCLKKWMDQKAEEGLTVSCIECRKPIVFEQLIFVDPKKVDDEQFENQKKEAHVLVREAAEMLEENYGQLPPHLWKALYLVIDLPSGIDRNLHGFHTAIPGLFLGHLRNAMGNCLPIGSTPNQTSSDPNTKIPLPSKFRALLADLPRNELSVVFASSKSIVLHLQRVLEKEGFGCKTLFVGQSEKESETAVSDWESPSEDKAAVTVLIVQAGAAACGLTLTAASQMFIIEPFRKHEEEKQAYARLHRYGQKKAVSCKVYYTPVSIESRLLEWRRRAKAHAPKEEKTVYAPLRDSNLKNDDDDEMEDMSGGDDSDCSSQSEDQGEREEKSNVTGDNEAAREENQTRFLLGLEEVEAGDERNETGRSS